MSYIAPPYPFDGAGPILQYGRSSHHFQKRILGPRRRTIVRRGVRRNAIEDGCDGPQRADCRRAVEILRFNAGYGRDHRRRSAKIRARPSARAAWFRARASATIVADLSIAVMLPWVS